MQEADDRMLFPWESQGDGYSSRAFGWPQLKVAIDMYNRRRLDGRPVYSVSEIAAEVKVTPEVLHKRFRQYRAWRERASQQARPIDVLEIEPGGQA